MTDIKRFIIKALRLPSSFLIKSKVIPDSITEDLDLDSQKPIMYVLKYDSASDLIALRRTCRKQGLPDPTSYLDINGKKISRVICLDKLLPVVAKKSTKRVTNAEPQLAELLALHQQDPELDIQLLPVFMTWGRYPGKETQDADILFNDQKKPSWLRKFFIVIFSGRHNLIQASNPLMLRTIVDEHGSDQFIAHKLLRVARFHFQRQRLAIAGPRLWERAQMINGLLAKPALKKVIEDEAKAQNISIEQSRELARGYLDEMAADYRENMIRVADRLLTWIWNRLYNGIHVNNFERVRKLAHDGHEVIYLPCHRSHMDYLLLTYVIYHQGLVPPHIAAGINLDFWPIGNMFRRSGAFFMRRSFRGNKLYSAAFREYLSNLLNKGYALKYYPESGRSRTGRLLKPKTGMIAMTVQNMLREQERPITIVPVYIGYEHVMEVNTYLRELKGAEKKKESMFQVLSIVRKLRNFGQGFLNVGEPINLAKLMNEQVPEWLNDIDPMAVNKPTWFPKFVDTLANKVMVGINDAAALNSVTLTGMVLAVADHHTLFRDELEKQLTLCVDLHKAHSPFSNISLPPEQTSGELLDTALGMKKFTVESGKIDLIGLEDDKAIEVTYYRNNILHLYMVPSLVAAILMEKSVTKTALIAELNTLLPIVCTEYFIELSAEQLSEHVDHILDSLNAHELANCQDETWTGVTHADDHYLQLHLLSLYAQETLQRYGIVLAVVEQNEPLSRIDLERESLERAKKLAKLHGIKGPEFVDKAIISQFVQTLKQQGFVQMDDEGRYISSETMPHLKTLLFNLIDGDVLNTLKHPG